MFDSEVDKICPNCNEVITKNNNILHETYCMKEMIECILCKEMIDKSFMEQHDHQKHKLIECKYCNQNYENQYIQDHIIHCQKQIKTCPFCLVFIKVEEFDNHIYSCGTKTVKCTTCKKSVKFRELEFHEDLCLIQQLEKHHDSVIFEEEISNLNKATNYILGNKRVKSSIPNHRNRRNDSNEKQSLTNNLEMLKQKREAANSKNKIQEMNVEKPNGGGILPNKILVNLLSGNSRQNIFAKYIPSESTTITATVAINDNNIPSKAKGNNYKMQQQQQPEEVEKTRQNSIANSKEKNATEMARKNVVYRSRKMTSNIYSQAGNNNFNNNNNNNNNISNIPLRNMSSHDSIKPRGLSEQYKLRINYNKKDISDEDDNNDQKTDKKRSSRFNEDMKLKDISNDYTNNIYKLNFKNYMGYNGFSTTTNAASNMNKNKKNYLNWNDNDKINKNTRHIEYFEDYLDAPISLNSDRSEIKIHGSPSNYENRSRSKNPKMYKAKQSHGINHEYSNNDYIFDEDDTIQTINNENM